MASQTTPTSSPGSVSLVRKCLGKNKQSDCLQNADHQNTRWECNFETQNKDEYIKHLKNILKRVKWRDLVESNKPDKDGWYRCVYFSTDRHHVENHYHKGSADSLSPSPSQGKSSRRWVNFTGSKRDAEDEDDETPEFAAREMKKLKQDASLLGFFQEQHSAMENAEGRESVALPDTMKVEEVIESVEKKLELGHEMALAALEKLQKGGYTVVSGLKAITKEGWEKLDLPIAIEEELKNQLTAPVYNPWYVPFAWSFHQGGYSWPTAAAYGGANGQPVYYPGYPSNFETQESVLGVGEVIEKDKEKTEDNVEGSGTAPEVGTTTQLVALDEKKDIPENKEQQPVPTLESIKVDVK